MLRLPLARAFYGLYFLEDLFKTPSEFRDKSEFVMSVFPPSWMVTAYDDEGRELDYWTDGSPARARRKKGQNIWQIEQSGNAEIYRKGCVIRD